MKANSKILFAASALAAAVLGGTSVRAASRVPTHVACVGDSITAGVGASSSSTNYPAVLQGLLGSSVQVKNFGHSGATLLSVGDLPYQQQSEYTAATSFVSGAGASAIVDVIIMLGTNDSKPYNWTVGTTTRAAQFQKDCAAMVDHFAQLATHPLVYLALPPRAFNNTYQISGTVIHDQILPLIKQVAADKGIPIIDVDTPTAGHPEDFPDGVHPNDAGYKIVAQTMHDGLLASIAGTGGSGGTGAGGASAAGGASGGTNTGGVSGAGGGRTATGGGSGTAGNSASSGTGGAAGASGGSAGSGVGGGSRSGGSSGAGGAGGGSTSGVAGAGGQGGAGGSSASAGSGGVGGATATGGASSSGGAATTSTSSGGVSGTGGSTSAASSMTGGTHGSGGASSSGGSASTAGKPGSSNGCSCAVGQAARAQRGAVWLVLFVVALATVRARRRIRSADRR